MILESEAGRTKFFGILVAQLVEGKRAPACKLRALHERPRAAGEERRHLSGRFQVALSVGEASAPKLATVKP